MADISGIASWMGVAGIGELKKYHKKFHELYIEACCGQVGTTCCDTYGKLADRSGVVLADDWIL